jgi:hypothetical protein
MPEEPDGDATGPDAVQRAIEYGIDVTLLIENLRYSLGDRLRRGEQAIQSVMEFRAQFGHVREP